ncbi:MAG: hypothetical protein WDN25_12850 [Acetobacteraceae bacterium]
MDAPRRPLRGRLAVHYIIDLVVSVSLVLLVGWMFQASVGDRSLRDALITQNDLYVAISRFTPHNLLLSYAAAIDQAARSVVFYPSSHDSLGSAIGQAAATALHMTVLLVLAIPRTVIAIYQETSGVAGWVVLAGLGGTVGTVLGLLLVARVSLWRLLLACLLMPFAIPVVFMMLQAFMVLMLDAFFWITALSPFAVACPVLCTLYWIAFPQADRGATAMVVLAIGRLLDVRR